MSQELFASFLFVAINFVGRLHSQGPIYPTSDVYNAISNTISKWVEHNAKYVGVVFDAEMSMATSRHVMSILQEIANFF